MGSYRLRATEMDGTSTIGANSTKVIKLFLHAVQFRLSVKINAIIVSITYTEDQESRSETFRGLFRLHFLLISK